MKVKRYLILMFILALALAACAENEVEDVAEPTAVSEQAEAPTTVPTEEPTAVPTPEPVAAAHGEHTAVSDPVEEAAPRFGLLRFGDSDTAPAGSFQLLMENVPPAPAGTHYELWLRDDSFNTLKLGEFSADGSVQFSDSTDKNLLATYSGAFISIEPDGVDDGEIGPIAFNGTLPGGSLLHIRHIVTAFPTNPEGKAFLIGAHGELHHALEHAGFLLDELANNNMREAHRHAEHVVNILDGENGPNFGDLDGDSVAQNPGDGFGVREYFLGAQEHAQLAADAEGATAEVKLHAGHVIISSQNGLNNINAAIAEALRIIASDSVGAAQPAADKLAQLLLVALEGQDANGDGVIAPIENEGGWQTAYEHALFMGAVELFAADGLVPAASATVEPPPVADAAPTEASVPAAPAEPAANVTISMANFAFQPNVITVASGTAVTWNNQDNGPRHSATAADSSFDTGLFAAGESVTHTFDKAGTYTYYCTLHGSPDGSGMAATITVTE